jgi:hypothetical protein
LKSKFALHLLNKIQIADAIASDQQRLVQTVPAVQSLRSVQIVPRKTSLRETCLNPCTQDNGASAVGLIRMAAMMSLF